jgi:hypothetical protein
MDTDENAEFPIGLFLTKRCVSFWKGLFANCANSRNSRKLPTLYPCSSVFIRGKNPLNCIVPAKV